MRNLKTLLNYLLKQKRDSAEWQDARNTLFPKSSKINKLLEGVLAGSSIDSGKKEEICLYAIQYILETVRYERLSENLVGKEKADLLWTFVEEVFDKFTSTFNPGKVKEAGSWGYLKTLLITESIDFIAQRILSADKSIALQKDWDVFFKVVKRNSKYEFERKRKPSGESDDFDEIFNNSILKFLDRHQKGGYDTNKSFTAYFSAIFKNESIDYFERLIGKTHTEKHATGEKDPEEDKSKNINLLHEIPRGKLEKLLQKKLQAVLQLRSYPHHLFSYLYCEPFYYLMESNGLRKKKKKNPGTKENFNTEIISKYIDQFGEQTLHSIFQGIKENLQKYNCSPPLSSFAMIDDKLSKTTVNVLQNQPTYQELRAKKGEQEYGDLKLIDFYYHADNPVEAVRQWCSRIKNSIDRKKTNASKANS